MNNNNDNGSTALLKNNILVRFVFICFLLHRRDLSALHFETSKICLKIFIFSVHINLY